jgi:hypothetical protein
MQYGFVKSAMTASAAALFLGLVGCGGEGETEAGQFSQTGKETDRAQKDMNGTGAGSDRDNSPGDTDRQRDPNGGMGANPGDCDTTPRPDDKLVCKAAELNGLACSLCYGPDGKLRSRECMHPPGRPPANEPVKCETKTLEDGTVCKVCYDEKGILLGRRCTPPNTGERPVHCEAITRADGTVCKVCFNGKMEIVTRECAPPPPPPSDEPRCKEVKADGVICYVCYDRAGMPIKRDCKPTREPPSDDPNTDPGSTGMCKQITRDNGAVCKVCYDARGNVTSSSCSN